MTDNFNGVGNFAFVYGFDEGLYECLYKTESLSLTDYKACANECRHTLETYIDIVRKKHQIDWNQLSISTVKDQIEHLKEEELIPNLGKVKYKRNDGQDKPADYWDFLRRAGNRGAHADTDVHNYSVKLTHDNMVKVLTGFYKLMKTHYEARISKDVRSSSFDKSKIPVGDYVVEEWYVPADSARSMCKKECHAYVLGHRKEIETYAILRMYDKREVTDEFALRNHHCFHAAARQFRGAPTGMAKTSPLDTLNSESSDYYILAYTFYHKPEPLRDKILKAMTPKQRICLCKDLADCLDKLHTASDPIYHRMLSYDSVFVCWENNEWVPYIVKFDYAKITAKSPDETVLANAVNAKKRTRDARLQKYISPEWNSIPQETASNKWEKADIFSLGVLFSDILMGCIGVKLISIDDLEDELDLSENLLDLLDGMQSEDPSNRYPLDFVKSVLDDELKRL